MADNPRQARSPARSLAQFASTILLSRKAAGKKKGNHTVTRGMSMEKTRQNSFRSLPSPLTLESKGIRGHASHQNFDDSQIGTAKVSSSSSVVTIPVDPVAEERGGESEEGEKKKGGNGWCKESINGSDTNGDLKAYEEAFRLFDRNGLGYITCAQLRRAMLTLGMDPSGDELHYMITAADLNRSGVVEFDEFMHMMKSYNQLRKRENSDDEMLKLIFQVFDSSSDGYISILEIEKAMKNLGECLTPEELQAMLSVADTSGDNIITFEEFRSVCCTDNSQ